MSHLFLYRTALTTVILLAEVTCTGKEPSPSPPVLPVPIPPPSSPDNLLQGILVIYNDETRTDHERLAAYANLLPPADDASLPPFRFRYGGNDIGEPPREWSLVEELEAHLKLFRSQREGLIRDLELRFQYTPPDRLIIPEPGTHGWMETFTTGGQVRVAYASGETLQANVYDTRFRMAPGHGRWYLVDWYEWPAGEGTWAYLKVRFLAGR